MPPDPGASVVPARRALSLAGLVALVALVALGDYWTGPEISFSIFFLIPISLGAWHFGRGIGLVLAGLSASGWLLADLYGGRPYSSDAILYWNAAVRLGFFAIIATVLAARRQAELRIYQLMRVKSDFVSTVSHELRTPMTCIKEGIAIVSDGSVGPLTDGQRHHLDTARRNVDRLARLLNDVLDFQKLEAGRMDFELRECAVNPLVSEEAEGYALLARRKGLVLALELATELPTVRCDRDRISQVLGNLLGNALQCTEVGRIEVGTVRLGSGVRVFVRDTGRGIRGEDLPHLFQSFSQVPAPQGTRTRGGTGLGLAIAARIVREHGGEVSVDSEPGKGSTFAFTLPAA